MYNIDVMTILLFLINGALGFLYSKKFLKMRMGGIWNFVVWMLLYLLVEMLLLQMLLFQKNITWQVFVTISFYAGKMIVKYIAK